MSETVKVLAFAGSLRKDSWNKKVVKVAAEGAKEAGAEVTYIDLKDYPLPVYDGDIEDKDGVPENALKLQKLFFEHDAILISTPEYNNSIPGPLKNMFDWMSRGEDGLDCFKGLVAGILSASPGGFGGLRAIYVLRHIFNYFRMYPLPYLQAVSGVHTKFDENGNITDEKEESEIKKIAQQTVELTQRLAKS